MPARNARQEFVRKFWSPVNTPLRDETGHLIGAVHNVQDVTTIVESMDDTGPSSETGMNLDQQTWTSMVTAIAREALGHQRARQTTEQLQYALASRIVIEQAKGIVAAREDISIDHAFVRLRAYARQHNAILRDVATAVVEAGQSV